MMDRGGTGHATASNDVSVVPRVAPYEGEPGRNRYELINTRGILTFGSVDVSCSHSLEPERASDIRLYVAVRSK